MKPLDVKRRKYFSEQISKIIFNESALNSLIKRRISNQIKYWSANGNSSALRLQKLTSHIEFHPWMLDQIEGFARVDALQNLQICRKKASSWRCTSGSSGAPLEYPLSKGWRIAHMAIWDAAYRFMTHGELKGYLDPSFKWAMARPPGGTVDNLPNQIECIPSRSDVIITDNFGLNTPDVLHGSATTIHWMLNNDVAKKWNPKYVVFTYESVPSDVFDIVKNTWPNAKLHIEYGSNDGGGAAFTCSMGRLHYWTIASMPTLKNGRLRVLDLWNKAAGFVAYECGDLIDFDLDCQCECGSYFPIVKIIGREAKTFILCNGSKISSICPFSSEEMKGVFQIQVRIQLDNVAIVVIRLEELIENNALSRISDRLLKLGFDRVVFSDWGHFFENHTLKGKFKVVVDDRPGSKPFIGKQYKSLKEQGFYDYHIFQNDSWGKGV
ncbi:MAG TPA: hypothetical protein ACFYEK_12435 [Candidatus Wunengus sp. YC60]|uniref:hypothetical protein n=1 Tax=Candidatus Wunengus sp. YC60 TaxID=3367697 RepID=UPI004026B43A